MKRFTETLKWSDPWFRKLKPEMKLLWAWILDNCDNAGVIDPDLELASFQIGYQYPLDSLSILSGRIKPLDNGKYIVIKFIAFQYGEKLSSKCKAHNPVFQSLKNNSINLEDIGYGKGIDRVQDKVQVKDKAKDTEEDKQETIYTPESRVALHYLNELSGKHFRESESSLAPINARMKEDGVDLEGVKKMIARQCKMWKDSNMQEYLRPETLFGKQKFDGYYAAKDLEIKTNENNSANNTKNQRPDRSAGTANEGIADQYKGLGRLA